MRRILINILKSNAIHRTFAVIIGILLWHIATEYSIYHKTIELPVVFYNVPKQATYTAPKKISVTFSGPRKYLRTLSDQTTGVHIDAERLTEKTTRLSVGSLDFFVPEYLHMVHCNPSYVEINKITC
jgi:hypothetical protein